MLPPVHVSAILGTLAVWISNPKKKNEWCRLTRTYHDIYEHDLFHVSFVGVLFDSCQAFPGFLTSAHHFCAFLL